MKLTVIPQPGLLEMCLCFAMQRTWIVGMSVNTKGTTRAPPLSNHLTYEAGKYDWYCEYPGTSFGNDNMPMIGLHKHMHANGKKRIVLIRATHDG